MSRWTQVRRARSAWEDQSVDLRLIRQRPQKTNGQRRCERSAPDEIRQRGMVPPPTTWIQVARPIMRGILGPVERASCGCGERRRRFGSAGGSCWTGAAQKRGDQRARHGQVGEELGGGLSRHRGETPMRLATNK